MIGLFATCLLSVPMFVSVPTASLSPDGTMLVISDSVAGMAMFDLLGEDIKSGEDRQVGEMVWSRKMVYYRATFSPNSKTFAVDTVGSSGPSTVFVIDSYTGDTLYRLHGAEDYCRLRFSKNGRFLYGASNGMIFKWDMRTGRRVYRRIIGDPDDDNIVRGFDTWARFEPGSNFRRVIIEQDGHTSTWSARGKKLSISAPFNSFFGSDKGVQYVADTGLFSSSGIYLHPIDPEKDFIHISDESSLAKSWARLTATAWHGMTLVGRSNDKHDLYVFSLRDGSLLNKISRPDALWRANMSLLTERAITAPTERGMQIWDTQTGKPVVSFVFDPEENSDAWAVYTESGAYIASKGDKRDEPGTRLLPEGRSWPEDAVEVQKAIRTVFPKRSGPVAVN